MLIRRAVGSGVVVVRGRLHGRGSITLRCASGAQSAVQRASGARSGACSGARSGAERSKALCALVDLAHLRVLAWRGIVQLIAGVQLYFPREDDDDMFICQTSRLHLSLDHHMGSHCHAYNGDSNTIEFFLPMSKLNT